MKELFLRKDYMTYKPKYFLYCQDCTIQIIKNDGTKKDFEISE